MRALILAAGLGTRLRPLTYVRAKGAVPVNGVPIVGRILRWVAGEGLTDLVVNLHHHPASIAAVVGDGKEFGARVRYSWENPVLGSAGGPRRAAPLLTDEGEDSFVVVNGDTLTSFPLRGLIDRHRESGALVTMALVPNPRPDFYGGAVVEDGVITGFTRRGQSRENFHFIGVQAARAAAFESLAEGVPAESVNALYPQLMRERPGAVAAYIVDAPFSDVGTPADYLETSLQLAAIEGDRLRGGERMTIDPDAIVRRTAVWDRVTIEAGAVLDDCIVCDDVHVPAGARYQRCALVPAGDGVCRDGERIEGGLLIKPF